MVTLVIKKGSNILAAINNPTFVPRIGELVGFKVSPSQTESRMVLNVEYVFDGNTVVIFISI